MGWSWTYLDTATTSKTSNGRLGDTLDVVSQYLAVTLRTPLAEALATFAASSHVEGRWLLEVVGKLRSRKCMERELEMSDGGDAKSGWRIELAGSRGGERYEIFLPAQETLLDQLR
jgi:hypothetical protein